MAAKHKVTTTVLPVNRRLSSAERRAAEVASISTRQADLKRESAERRARRAGTETPPAGSGGDAR
jgi:hypothetical protein